MTAESTFSIGLVLSVLRRRAWIIVIAFVVIAGAAFGYSRLQKKMYTAQAQLHFGTNTAVSLVSGSSSVNQSAAANVALVELGTTAATTAQLVGDGLTAGRVRAILSVSALGTTDSFITLSGTAASPTLAANVVNTYAQVFVRNEASQSTGYYKRLLAVVSRQLARLPLKQRNSSNGLALEAKIQSLSELADSPPSVQIAQAASVPGSPSSPRTTRNTLIGAVFGLLLGVGLVVGLESIDQVVREPRELEQLFGLPLLGVIPSNARLSRTQLDETDSPVIPTAETEAFQLVSAHLRYFNVDRNIHTLLVTSASPGAGKTTVSIHLAAAAARRGLKVLLLEVDLRRPSVARKLGLSPDPGLSELLIGAAEFDEVCQQVHLESTSEEEAPSVDMILAGSTTPPNPVSLIESHAMQDLLKASSDYDLVILDTPPVTAVSDTFSLLKHVDGVVVVGRPGKDNRRPVHQARETLEGVQAPLLGVIANGVKGAEGANYYYYGYAQ